MGDMVNMSGVSERLMREARKVCSKQTNADRIQSMSIDELAEFLSLCVSDCQGRKLEQKEFCEGCPFDSGVGYCTEKRIKKWLQSEVEG